MAREPTTYPFIRSTKDMITFYDEFGIKLSPFFNRPTFKSCYNVYMEIYCKIHSIKIEDLAPFMTPNTDFEFDHLYQEGEAALTLVQSVNSVLEKCSFNEGPFTLNDLHEPTYPNKKRLYTILSCLLNYLRFHGNLATQHKNLHQDDEREYARRNELNTQLEELYKINESLKTKFNDKKISVEQRCKDERESNWSLKDAFETFNNDKMALEQIDHQLNQRMTLLGKNKGSIEILNKEIMEASSKIVDSPAEFVQKLQSLKTNCESKRGKKNDLMEDLYKKKNQLTYEEQVRLQCQESLNFTKNASSIDLKELKKAVCCKEQEKAKLNKELLEAVSDHQKECDRKKEIFQALLELKKIEGNKDQNLKALETEISEQINKNYEQISKENKKKTQWKEKISERTLNIEQVVSKEKETAGIMVLSMQNIKKKALEMR